MGLRVLVFQHNMESPAGLVQRALDAAGVATTTLLGERRITIPDDATEHDGLVLLGGAMSANDDARCPHFPQLLDLVRGYVEHRRPVLGLCLGGQQIARAFGATVHEKAAPEWGFPALRPLPAAADDPLLHDLSAETGFMQWHDDRFDIPDGAVQLLSGDGCPTQAFRIADTAWAFQGHLEVDERIASRWAELREDRFGIPGGRALVEAAREAELARAVEAGSRIAARWVELVAARAQERWSDS